MENGKRVGFITSGGYGHRVQKSLAMGLINTDLAESGQEIDVHIVGIGNLGKSFLGGFNSISEGPNLYLYESNKDIVDSFSGKQEIKSTLGQLDEGVLLLCINQII